MITFEPIGHILLEENRFFLELKPEFWPAVEGLEEFSHLQVFWHFNLYDTAENRRVLQCQKPYRNGPDSVGVFATRSPLRPNPMALTPCALIGIDKARHRLELNYIDAENNTPVLDIKPYEASLDRVRDIRSPKWASHWPQWYEESGEFDWSQEFNF